MTSSLPEREGAQPTLAYLRSTARQKPKEAFKTWWSTAPPEQYKRSSLKATTGCPPELSLPCIPSLNTAVNLAIGKDFTKFVNLSKTSAIFDKISPNH
ncbi:reverse transcriptase domain protein [Fusarium oxysporum f. sp. phaseoli]